MLKAASLFLMASVAMADSEVGRTIHKSIRAEGVKNIQVEVHVAELEIRTGPAREILISGSIRREYDGERGRERATEIVEGTDIEVLIRGDQATIREKRAASARSGTARWVSSEIDIRITVPAGSNLEVEMNVGELDIEGDFRDLDVEMNVGELSVRLPKRNVREMSASTRIGEVHADLGERTITKEGILAGRTRYVSDTGIGIVELSLDIGEIDVALEGGL